MNQNDFKLIGIIACISLVALFLISFTSKDGNNVVVYYEDKEILNISLNEDNIYTVNGELGDIVIEVKNSKVRVNEENSPRHLCSNQGWIEKPYESIICLPNKIVINIESDSSLDAVVK